MNNVRKSFDGSIRLLSTGFIAGTLSLALLSPGFAEDKSSTEASSAKEESLPPVEESLSELTDSVMLIRFVPLEVSKYSEAEGLDEKVKNAQSTLEFINSSSSLLVHMEALRRAYATYGENPEEKSEFLAGLKSRYMAEPQNASYYFDYGYAQLVMDGNKNGLFFLRKANDKLMSPYTSLAYAIAQIDMDIYAEKASPHELTTRKMDAMYKLKDALAFNKDDRLPGVWPSYIHILEGLKAYSAYDSLQSEDVTVIYVPYVTVLSSQETGNQYMALSSNSSDSAEEIASEEQSSAESDIETSCNLSSDSSNWSQLAFSKSMDLDNDGKAESVNFFKKGSDSEPYTVKVMDQSNRVIGELTSYKAPHIIEDLEGDKQYELVIRQFDKEPYHPLYVYRWNGNCFAQDKRVSSFFR